MDHKDYNINFSLDIALHVLILFTFLTIFFFAYVSKLEKQTLDNTVSGAINDNTNNFLNNVDSITKKYSVNVDWNAVNNIADELIKNSQGEVPEIKSNNEKLFRGSIIAISVAFVLFISTVVFLKYYLGYDIHIGHILLMNVIIFSITGLIEYLFFTNVASKYIPVTPDVISKTMLERAKYNIDN
jgi:hypothetical protein